MRNRILKLTPLSITISLAMVFSYVESQIPALVTIPGIKVGLANIAVIFTLYKLGVKEAIAVSTIRVLLVSFLFGNTVSLIYSISGAILSLLAMIILKKLTRLTEITVSVVGGVAHNIGQIVAASFMLSTNVVVYYLPFLLISGTIAGILIGVVSAILVKRVRIDYK